MLTRKCIAGAKTDYSVTSGRNAYPATRPTVPVAASVIKPGRYYANARSIVCSLIFILISEMLRVGVEMD